MIRLSVVILALLSGVSSTATAQSSPPAQTSITYRYDALGRLIRVEYPNGRVVTYSYDKAGNRTVVTVGG